MPSDSPSSKDIPVFDGRSMRQGVISIPLKKRIQNNLQQKQAIIIDLNLEYSAGGREAAKQWVLEHAARSEKERKSIRTPNDQYVAMELTGKRIVELVQKDSQQAQERFLKLSELDRQRTSASAFRAVFRVWPDFDAGILVNRSIATVKADAAGRAFSSSGQGILWAVLDTGIDPTHPHFSTYGTLNLDPSFEHKNFTSDSGDGLSDANGHGTHVAGIIAGELSQTKERSFSAVLSQQNEDDDTEFLVQRPETMSGMAPRCQILSLKVLNSEGRGKTSGIIEALTYIQQLNGYGRRLRVHGVNLSLGHNFDPEWFACGQSPLCVEVNRLVKSGVAVVVAAGNSGYGALNLANGNTHMAGLALTVNDPGNAEEAFTVGSTHRFMPHTYGVSYFSSKGPTGDGRLKPDIVAPGEKILSCAAGKMAEEQKLADKDCQYIESSGTSMAAPHVSGALAAFLSVRPEFIGRPEELKEIFCRTATDLKRERHFQGAGLVDLMRALQSV